MDDPRDPNDYERRQRDAEAEMPEFDSEVDEVAQEEIAGALRYGSFELKYAAPCDRCKRLLPIGTKVVGRKLGDQWIVEEFSCPEKP